jgi:vacuolar-type H+-ATPase subunit H
LATAEKTSNSILGQVAQHEQQLLAQIEASEEESQRIIDEARAEARKHLQTSEAELIEEVAKLRRQAEDARLQAFQATVDAAEKRLESLRVETARRVPELADRALGLFLPGGAKGEAE